MGPYDPGRRIVLRGVASAVTALLAGCGTRPGGSPVQTPDPTRGPTERATGGDEVRRSTDGAITATEPPSATTDAHSSNAILLPSVEVNESPGGLVSIRPPNKVVLLDFFATWCAPCKPEMANLRAARERFSRETVYIISITRETDRTAIKEFWKRHQATWPVVMDPNLRAFRKFSVTNVPTIVVLTPNGTEVGRHAGLVGEATITSAIETALERSEVV